MSNAEAEAIDSLATSPYVLDWGSPMGAIFTSNETKICDQNFLKGESVGDTAAQIGRLIADLGLASPETVPTVQARLNSSCEGSLFEVRVPPAMQSKGSPSRRGTPAKMKAIKAKLDELLGGPRSVPVGIAYCGDVLSRESAYCSPAHVSVVIGRRRNGDVCEYLVRDSFGADCPYRFGCEEGAVWGPSEILIRSIESLTWIPPR